MGEVAKMEAAAVPVGDLCTHLTLLPRDATLITYPPSSAPRAYSDPQPPTLNPYLRV